MADNVVEIRVTSRNDTRAGFDAAKTDAELAGDEAGQGFASRFASRLSSSFGSSASGGGGILSSVFGIATSSPEGLAVVAAAAASAVAEVGALVTGLTAAAVGVGSFALLALPTFDKIKNAYTAISAAQKTYNAAVAKEAMAPSKTNETAVKNAALALKLAQQSAGPGISGAVAGVQSLVGAFEKLSTAFQPQALAVFNDTLKIANQLLPFVAKFAQAAAPSIEKLMTALSKSISSTGFKSFTDALAKISPGAITAIGNGMIMLTTRIGLLLERFTRGGDVINAFKILFGTLDGVMIGVTWAIGAVMTGFDVLWSELKTFGRGITDFAKRAEADLANWAQVVDNIFGNVNNWFNVTLPTGIATAISWFEQLPGKIVAALAKLGDMLFSAGQHAIQRLIDGLGSMLGSLGSMASTVASKIAGFFGLSPAKEGPLSGGGAPEIRGAHFVQDFAKGMRGSLAHLGAAAGAVAGAAAGGLGGVGGGLHVTLELGPNFQRQTGLSAAQLQAIRYEVRTKGGGSVQQAFGKKAGM